MAVTEQRSIDRPRARRLDKAERKAMLLRHAIAVFAHRGLGAAHHIEIAERANVSEPTVFFYFPTREVLVAEVLDEVARFFLDMGETVHAKRVSAPQIFLAHSRKFADAVDTHPDYIRVLLEWSTAQSDEVRAAYLRFHQEILATLTRTIRRWRAETGRNRDTAAKDEARVFAAAGYVLAHMKLAKLPTWQIERFIQTLVRDTLVEPAPVQRTR
jgi:TetR/AcrR family hemagglutinin/protease transcriptional regulator